MSISRQIGSIASDKRAQTAAKVLAALGVTGAVGGVGYSVGKKKGANNAIKEALPIMKNMNEQENAQIARHFYEQGANSVIDSSANLGSIPKIASYQNAAAKLLRILRG
jgi:hypothetical protein